ncbi:Cupredoxin [Cadophora sp. MPI-SDFR-AT-0126]|nr:Cupredoxin [Leotiomycetes sp. MPI-SDFR-AT-0126]
MRSLKFITLLLGPLVAGQASYPELPPQYLLTTTPVTPLPQGFPWGGKTANNTNAYPPHTGVIRAYDFVITRGWAAPDGYYKDVMLVNNQFPGPLIEANWGDTIQVTVHNQITAPEEGTALHWHGILQKDMQWMDGVPGVQQCPIVPGGSFTYSFLADLYGTTWYHSHYSGQYAGGVVGPLVIHGPSTVAYDTDVGPVILGDHYHREYFDIVKDTMSTDINKVIQLSDNNLINGRNNFDCTTKASGDTRQCFSNAATSKFRFYPGKVHRLRLINAGAEATLMFSIDGHTMKVIANDFVPIIPYDSKVVTLGVGQRTDVLVTGLAGTPAPVVMRSYIAACSLFNQPVAKAMVYYRTQDATAAMPNTSPWPEFTSAVANQCGNDALTLTKPWYPITPAAVPSTTRNVAINFGQNASGNWLWTMDGSSFRVNYNQPVLLLSKTGNNSFPTNWNSYNFGSNATVRIHIQNPGFAAHPMHLHGHNFWVLAEGTGTWDGTTIINAANPQRRDTQIVRAGGYLVIQINQDNPGAWPFHCHIAWHVSAGLYITVLERPADIANLPIPSIMAQTCRDWASYTNTTVVDQIDSGL